MFPVVRAMLNCIFIFGAMRRARILTGNLIHSKNVSILAYRARDRMSVCVNRRFFAVPPLISRVKR